MRSLADKLVWSGAALIAVSSVVTLVSWKTAPFQILPGDEIEVATPATGSAKFSITIKNTGGDSIRLVDTKSDCSCTSATTLASQLIKPSDQYSMEFEWTPKNRENPRDRSVLLILDVKGELTTVPVRIVPSTRQG